MDLINPSRAEAGKPGDNYVDTMVADGLAPPIAKASATVELNMQDEKDTVSSTRNYFFNLPAKSLCWEMREITNILFCFP